MKLGVLLPTFRDNADDALVCAADAEQAGIDGVFAFDHLWPMGSPQRPSLAPFPVLAAIAARHQRLFLGPLVARVGLVSTHKLVEQFTSLDALAPGRVIAALGTGDKLSEAEQRAYDLGDLSADERRQLMAEAAEALLPLMGVWCGAGSSQTNDLARRYGVEINLWDATPAKVRELARGGPVSWAGPLGDDAIAKLDELNDLNVTWAIASAPFKLERMKEWREAH